MSGLKLPSLIILSLSMTPPVPGSCYLGQIAQERKDHSYCSLTYVLCSLGVLCVCLCTGRCSMFQKPYYSCLRSTLRFRVAFTSSTTTVGRKYRNSLTAYCRLHTHQMRCVYCVYVCVCGFTNMTPTSCRDLWRCTVVSANQIGTMRASLNNACSVTGCRGHRSCHEGSTTMFR